MPRAVIYIAAAFLVAGVLPLPYGFYTLLRIISCAVFCWAAFVAYERNEAVLPWLFLVVAIIFNPIIRISFPKEVWAVIDFCSAVLLFMTRDRIEEKGESRI